MKQVKYIDISPHRSILTKIAQTGYSIQEALPGKKTFITKFLQQLVHKYGNNSSRSEFI